MFVLYRSSRPDIVLSDIVLYLGVFCQKTHSPSQKEQIYRSLTSNWVNHPSRIAETHSGRRMRQLTIKTDLPRPPSIFGQTPRTWRNHSRKSESESVESDLSDASTRTIRFRISYKYITRTTPLPSGSSDEEELATDTESAGTDHIADEYYKEIEGPAWVCE